MTSHDKVDPKGEEQGCMIDEVTKTSFLIILVSELPDSRERMHKKRYEGTHGQEREQVGHNTIPTVAHAITSAMLTSVYTVTVVKLTKR